MALPIFAKDKIKLVLLKSSSMSAIYSLDKFSGYFSLAYALKLVEIKFLRNSWNESAVDIFLAVLLIFSTNDRFRTWDVCC